MDKKGVVTSEFWVSIGAAIAAVLSPIVAIVVGRGLVTTAEGELVMSVVTGVLGLVAVIVPSWVAVRYTQARTELKVKKNGN